MGTPLAIDGRLSQVDHSLENLAEDLVILLIENYNKKALSLGSGYNGSDSFSCFSITDSEFENVFLHLRYNGGYSIELKCVGADSPCTVNFELDDVLFLRFPEEMKEELKEAYNNIIFQ